MCCWKKYGRPYTSALAHVWGSSTTSPTPTDSDSKHPPTNQQQQQQQPLPPPQNYQRPLLLTNFHPSPAAAYTGIVMNHSYMRPGLIERGAQQNRIRPSQFQPAPAPAPAPPPPPPSLVAPEPSGTQNEKHGYGYAYGNAQQNSFAPPPLPPPASAPLQPGVVPPQQYTSMPSNGYLAQQQSGLPVLPGDAGIGGV
ncbi:hypothetical protein QFC24_005002 [Naganishia onofrii]|uniref:Uncharacterized protein n=1 Tax=Naganishia onofrii TaxID=1851511 RepID=A0ACC2XCB3_9TREE|nr:hypothetical protein QFC24_005002 [Naganishia onofrii]